LFKTFAAAKVQQFFEICNRKMYFAAISLLFYTNCTKLWINIWWFQKKAVPLCAETEKK